MDKYFILRMIHILSALISTGTGAGIAFFMFMTYRSKNIEALVIVSKLVVRADWLFTAPAVVIQFVSGILLMNQLGYSFNSVWFYWVISLFVLVGICWLPVVVIQYRLRDLAKESLQKNEINQKLNNVMKIWIVLGIIAFSAIIVIYWLMIFKPFPIA